MKLEVKSPFDNAIVGEIELNSLNEMLKKIELLEQFHSKSNDKLKPYQRIAILEKIVTLLHRDYDKIIEIAIAEGGKPLKDSIIEMNRAIDGVKIAIQSLRNWVGEQIPMEITQSSINRFAFTTREPIGVVLALSAFNHPINLIIHQVIPAFAVGTPILIKPAPKTPLTCKKLVELFYEAGISEDYLQFGNCTNEVTAELVKNDKISYLSFIGSANVGWGIVKKLHNGVRYGLEHGGTAPVIISDDIKSSEDIAKIANLITKGGYYHSGQVCVSTQKVYLHKSISNEFNTFMKSHADKLILDNPFDIKTDLGPLISQDAINKIDNMVKESLYNNKTELIYGGERFGDTFYAPTLILNPSNEAIITNNEVFGPVICVYEYENIESAIQLANNSPYTFHSSIFTNSIKKAFELADKINGTGIMINDHTAFRTDWMPFGGGKNSGAGIGGIEYSMKEYSYEKLKVFNLNF